ncbi:hypothetical protein IFM47457_07008 [Aspergillus lentulus]|nr:hypothetical protein IFM47457_07008 [Aspergillus lentulus]
MKGKGEPQHEHPPRGSAFMMRFTEFRIHTRPHKLQPDTACDKSLDFWGRARSAANTESLRRERGEKRKVLELRCLPSYPSVSTIRLLKTNVCLYIVPSVNSHSKVRGENVARLAAQSGSLPIPSAGLSVEKAGEAKF